MEIKSASDFQLASDLLKGTPSAPVRLVNEFVTASAYNKKLLNKANVKQVKVAKDASDFKFSSPCFIRHIDVYAADSETIERKLSLSSLDFQGGKSLLVPRINQVKSSDGAVSNVVRYEVGRFCNGFEAKAELLLKSIFATRFMVYGYTLDQLEASVDSVVKVNNVLNGLEQYFQDKIKENDLLEAKRLELVKHVEQVNGSIKSLSATKASAVTEIKKLDASLKQKRADEGLLSQQIEEMKSNLSNSQNNEAQLKNSVQILNREISEKRNELKSIVDDRSLISDEYKDYVLEGKAQSNAYQWFLYLSIVIIAVCAVYLITGAQRILEHGSSDYRQILALVMQRAPFAAAITMIVAVAWKLGEMFVSRIMAIHSQRLALARLLVIAKDTVYSSTNNLEITDEEKFRERIKLKLQMLRSHLTSELGKDFEYVSAPEGKMKDSSEPEVNLEGVVEKGSKA